MLQQSNLTVNQVFGVAVNPLLCEMLLSCYKYPAISIISIIMSLKFQLPFAYSAAQYSTVHDAIDTEGVTTAIVKTRSARVTFQPPFKFVKKQPCGRCLEAAGFDVCGSFDCGRHG